MAAQSSVDRVRAALLAAGHADTIAEFPEGTRSAADAAAAIGCGVAQIAKSIVFRAITHAGERVALVIASGVNRVSVAKVEAVLGAKLKRADGDWVRERTGFAIGGVAPLANLSPPLLVFDQDLLALHPVWAAAGSPRHVFSTEASALARITGAVVADVREDAV
jgi:prolyl-tRNA editing enzyme YbaK/EbsC (Cys-tRNA(Pro) deacylase)